MGKEEKTQLEKEKAEKKKPQSPDNKLKENKAAAEKLQTSTKKKEPEKPKWTLNPVDTTGVGDEKTNITSVGPTLTSPNGKTRITAGYTSMTERPDPNMQESQRSGVGVTVQTTPGEVVSGIKKLGNGIKNLFKKKK